jgi:histidinol-phosphate aminotransferase
MFEKSARRAGGRVRPVAWSGDTFPVDAVIAAAGPETAAVALVTPNNPTGAVIVREDLERLRRALPGVTFLLDLAYVEFADEDPTDWALGQPDILILRTFSKAWGLAGARVGYVLGDADDLATLGAWGQPYAVSGPSLTLARAALRGGRGRMLAGVSQVRRERERLRLFLEERDIPTWPSQANFVLARVRRPEFLARGLAALGIAVRTWPDNAERRGWVRLTCPGDEAVYRRLVQALATCLQPEALLLDMDGVLADEGPSYRETVRATLASFGVDVERPQLAAAKAAGGSNDDILLTGELLRAAGREVDTEEVRQRFQARYLGTDGEPGLQEQERLIPDADLLARLAGRMPLAIVTGRPRAEAEAFLERFGLSALIAVLITAEDAPSKPDPAPVRLALERLDCRRAWMVGDTPADCEAARRAGVLPLGVRPPAPEDRVGDGPLERAGAVRVLENLSEIEEVLP